MFSSIIDWIFYIFTSIFKFFFIIFLILFPFEDRLSENVHFISNGFYIGSFYNYWNYLIETNGRESNLLIIYDKSIEYSIGVFEWWIRLDCPHRNVDFYHLNVNPRITGLPDPHIYIMYPFAKTLQFSGHGLKLLNKAAPFVFAAFLIDDYKTVYDVVGQNPGKGVKEAGFILAKYVFCWYGARFGAYLAGFILPGIGSLFGSLGGGVVGRMIFSRILESKF